MWSRVQMQGSGVCRVHSAGFKRLKRLVHRTPMIHSTSSFHSTAEAFSQHFHIHTCPHTHILYIHMLTPTYNHPHTRLFSHLCASAGIAGCPSSFFSGKQAGDGPEEKRRNIPCPLFRDALLVCLQNWGFSRSSMSSSHSTREHWQENRHPGHQTIDVKHVSQVPDTNDSHGSGIAVYPTHDRQVDC